MGGRGGFSLSASAWRCGLLVLVVLLSLTTVRGATAVADDDVARGLLAAGDQQLGLGRSHYADALAKYTEALVRNPHSERGLLSRAELLQMLQRPLEALEDLDALLGLAPANAVARGRRAALRAQTGDLRAAASDAAAALATLEATEKGSTRHRQAGKLAASLAHYAAKWEAVQAAMERAPTPGARRGANAECAALLEDVIREHGGRDSVDWRLRRAACAIRGGLHQIATTELGFVLRRSPNNLEAIELNAAALRGLGAVEQARSELRRCLSVDPENAACARLHRHIRRQVRDLERIERLVEGKQCAKAVALMDEAMAAEEDPPYEEQIMRWRCSCHVALKDTAAGLKSCRSLVDRLGPDSPLSHDAYLQLAELFLLDDDFDEAERAVEQAKRINPQSGAAHNLEQRIHSLRQQAGRKDYYKLLGLKRSASEQDIRRAYRKLARELHPDKLRSVEMSEKEREKADMRFRDINEAKEVLLDAEKRARYDNGEDLSQPAGHGGPQHPFHGSHFTFQTGGFPGGMPGGFARMFQQQGGQFFRHG